MFTNLFLVCFQTKDNDTYAYVDLWLSHDGDRNQQDNQLWARFFYNTFFYWLTNLLIGKFIQVGENKPTKQLTLKLVSFIKH